METESIPVGRTRAEIRAREKLIKDFYAHWISEHPNKKVWNHSLRAYICVKFISINETKEKAARNIESTRAVLHLTEVLKGAVKVREQPIKRDVDNQKQFDRMVVLKYGDVKLTVGIQRSSQEYVQYCVTVPGKTNKDKATTKK